MAARRPKLPVERAIGDYVAAGDIWHDKAGLQIGKLVEAKPADDKSTWREVALRVRPEWTDEQFEECWLDFIEYRRQMCI